MAQATATRLQGRAPGAFSLARGTRTSPATPAVYYVCSGRVRYEQVASSGHQAAVGVFGPGEAFVYRRPWLPGSPSACIEALEDSRLLVVRERDMAELVATEPQLAARLMAAVARQAGETVELASELALADTRQRVLRALVRLSDRHAEPEADGAFLRIVVPLKHQDLAALVGACRETVTSVLAELSRRGVVRTGRCAIAVNRDRAMELLEEAERA
jgi:CRP-like cAMP-binding protein